MASIAEQVAAFLEKIWNRPQQKPEDVWIYQRALGSKFVEFVGFAEKMFRGLAGKLNVIEAQQASILKALNLSAEPADTSPQAPQAQAARTPKADMVRLDSMGAEMTPQEQDAEERADMMTDGKIDMSRYVPRGTARPPQQNVQATVPPPAPPAEAAPSNPNGQS